MRNRLFNLAASLALHGARVLVVDLDPQGNASTALGIDHHAEVPSIYDVLVDSRPLSEVVQPVPGDVDRDHAGPLGDHLGDPQSVPHVQCEWRHDASPHHGGDDHYIEANPYCTTKARPEQLLPVGELVREAHEKVCPYSHATRNNVSVSFEVIGA